MKINNNIYLDLHEELDRVRRRIVTSGVDHELTYNDEDALFQVSSKLWTMGIVCEKQKEAEQKQMILDKEFKGE